MADNTQDLQGMLAHQLVTHPNSVQGTVVDVRSALSGSISISHAFVEAAANTNPGAFRLFTSKDTAATPALDSWKYSGLSVEAALVTPNVHAIDGAGASATDKLIPIAATTGIVAKSDIYIRDAGVLADSEWHTVDIIDAGVSVTIMMGIVKAKDTSDFLSSDAQQFEIPLDFSGTSHIRLDFSHEGAAGANVHIHAEVLITTDFV